MDPETRTAVNELRETVASQRQSLRLLDTAIEDMARDLDQRLRQLEMRGRGDNSMTTSNIPPRCAVVWDGPHSYLEPDLAAPPVLRLADLEERAAIQGARERLQDLVAYTSRARRAGSRESVRLAQNPADVVARIEDYARDVLELLGGEACGHGLACAGAEACAREGG